MSRAPSSFRETDIKRAVRALEAAGKQVDAVEIADGRIKIKIRNGGNGADDNDDNDKTSEWDDKYGDH